MGGLCEGRACVITGAGRGLGRAYAEALVAQGAKVVVNDVDASAVEATVQALRDAGGDALGHTADASVADGAE